VAGISGPDAEGYAWYWIEWDHGTGWIRKDLVQLSGECAEYFLDLPTEPEPEAFQPDPEPGDRFPLPVDYPVIQAYHNHHPAIDLDAPAGTPVEAAAAGVVAACVTCSKCDSEHLAASPSWLTRAQQSEVFEDPAWGYGLGNHVIVRHAFAHLPEALRLWMADRGLMDGYAFVLYGHLSAMHVSPGDEVTAGTVLGVSGDTGHTARPSLHLEVRAGEAPEIGDTWQALLPAHPFLMFYTAAR
jgi:murein DD-endopeptidase MepM/ murein hydrolase activator NlpD